MVDLVLGQGGTLKAEHGTGRIMAPFVRRQYGDELYDVMREIKRLFDPHACSTPASCSPRTRTSYLRDLKTAPTVEAEVDRCVECGYCEPVCPSQDLTAHAAAADRAAPRDGQRRGRGDDRAARRLERDYDYDGVQTCAVDGMCQTACPVPSTPATCAPAAGRAGRGPVQNAAWDGAARHWGAATRGAGAALTAADALPAAVAGRDPGSAAVLGAEPVPLYDAGLPRGGQARRPVHAPVAEAVFFPACIGTMFGAGRHSGCRDSFLRAVRAGRDRAVRAGGIGVAVLRHSVEVQGPHSRLRPDDRAGAPSLREATGDGRAPGRERRGVVHRGPAHHARSADDRSGSSGLRVVDAVELRHRAVLPRSP